MIHWGTLQAAVKKKIIVYSSIIGAVATTFTVINFAFAYDDRRNEYVDIKVADSSQAVLKAINSTNERLDMQIARETTREINGIIRELSALEFKVNDGTASSYEKTRIKELEKQLQTLRDELTVGSTAPVH